MTRGRPARAGQRGLTLAEVLVATAVIGVGLVALIAVYPLAMGGVEGARERSTATFLAEGRLEELKALALDDPTLTGATFLPGTATEPAVAGSPRYARRTTVADGAAPGTRVIRIVVFYSPAVTVGAPAPRRGVSVGTMFSARQ
jgi:prepilin-type N-terminal cleavage/methylation domain-containing protein